MSSSFDPRDPRWERCPEGCRPAAGTHRVDCPNGAEDALLRLAENCTYTLAEVKEMGWLPPGIANELREALEPFADPHNWHFNYDGPGIVWAPDGTFNLADCEKPIDRAKDVMRRV